MEYKAAHKSNHQCALITRSFLVFRHTMKAVTAANHWIRSGKITTKTKMLHSLICNKTTGVLCVAAGSCLCAIQFSFVFRAFT